MAMSICFRLTYIKGHIKLSSKSENAVDSDRLLKFVHNMECEHTVRRLHGARGARAPPLLQMAGHGGTVSIEEQQPRKRPNCTDHHESARQND